MAQSRKKFVELAENRVSRVIQDLRLIGNLSNKSNYEYSEEDVEKIINTLRNEVDKTKKRFESVTSKKKDFFKL